MNKKKIYLFLKAGAEAEQRFLKCRRYFAGPFGRQIQRTHGATGDSNREPGLLQPNLLSGTVPQLFFLKRPARQLR